MAVTGLVLALVGIFVPCLLPIAIPFGGVGLARARKIGGYGHGQALAAVIVASVFLTGWILLVTLVLFASP